MSERTLFLAWQDDSSRQWFPVGRLDADVGKISIAFAISAARGVQSRRSDFRLCWGFQICRKIIGHPSCFRSFRTES